VAFEYKLFLSGVLMEDVENIVEDIRRDLRIIKDKISQFKQDVLTKQDSNNKYNSSINNSQNSESTKREDNEKFGVVEDRQISVS
jgi:hypothetical protein